jgi:hypothetical protein
MSEFKITAWFEPGHNKIKDIKVGIPVKIETAPKEQYAELLGTAEPICKNLDESYDFDVKLIYHNEKIVEYLYPVLCYDTNIDILRLCFISDNRLYPYAIKAGEQV